MYVMVNLYANLAGLSCPVVWLKSSLDVAVKVFFRWLTSKSLDWIKQITHCYVGWPPFNLLKALREKTEPSREEGISCFQIAFRVKSAILTPATISRLAACPNRFGPGNLANQSPSISQSLSPSPIYMYGYIHIHKHPVSSVFLENPDKYNVCSFI